VLADRSGWFAASSLVLAFLRYVSSERFGKAVQNVRRYDQW